MSEKKRKWSFEEWSTTFDAIFKMYVKASDKGNDKLRYSKMLVDHCSMNYDFKWNRGVL